MIRLGVRVPRDHAELVAAELPEIAPGGLEERDLDHDTVELAIYGAPGELPDRGPLRATVGDALVDVVTTEEPMTGTTAGATGTGRSTSARCACARRGSRGATTPSTSPSTPPRRSAPGSHATTRLTLELLADAGAPEGALADWGCGSGVLAIAAAKLGWAPVARLRRRAGSRSRRPRWTARATNGVDGRCVARCDLRRGPGRRAPTVLGQPRPPAAARGRRRTSTRAPERMIISGLLRRTRPTRWPLRSPAQPARGRRGARAASGARC